MFARWWNVGLVHHAPGFLMQKSRPSEPFPLADPGPPKSRTRYSSLRCRRCDSRVLHHERVLVVVVDAIEVNSPVQCSRCRVFAILYQLGVRAVEFLLRGLTEAAVVKLEAILVSHRRTLLQVLNGDQRAVLADEVLHHLSDHGFEGVGADDLDTKSSSCCSRETYIAASCPDDDFTYAVGDATIAVGVDGDPREGQLGWIGLPGGNVLVVRPGVATVGAVAEKVNATAAVRTRAACRPCRSDAAATAPGVSYHGMTKCGEISPSCGLCSAALRDARTAGAVDRCALNRVCLRRRKKVNFHSGRSQEHLEQCLSECYRRQSHWSRLSHWSHWSH